MKPLILATGVRDEIDMALLLSSDPAAFRRTIDRDLGIIRANPQIAAKVTRTGIRHFHMIGYPYGIVYAEDVNWIRILAFAHGARKPGYWKKRLRKP